MYNISTERKNKAEVGIFGHLAKACNSLFEVEHIHIKKNRQR